MAVLRLPKPNLITGENCVLVRALTGERLEEARVVALDTNPNDATDWLAIVQTTRGAERVDSSRENRTAESWRAPHWIFDQEQTCYKPPGTKWDERRGEFMPEGDALPAKREIPRPLVEETRAQWVGRLRKQWPQLECEDGKVLTAEMWNEEMAKRSAPHGGGPTAGVAPGFAAT